MGMMEFELSKRWRSQSGGGSGVWGRRAAKAREVEVEVGEVIGSDGGRERSRGHLRKAEVDQRLHGRVVLAKIGTSAVNGDVDPKRDLDGDDAEGVLSAGNLCWCLRGQGYLSLTAGLLPPRLLVSKAH